MDPRDGQSKLASRVNDDTEGFAPNSYRAGSGTSTYVARTGSASRKPPAEAGLATSRTRV